MAMNEFGCDKVKLAPGALKKRFQLNTSYVMRLTSENLLRNFYLEAGLWSYSGQGGTTTASSANMDIPENWHWGWESPTCELRGHITGHWLSAAAKIFAQTNDQLVKAKADFIVAELAKCQVENGGEWLAAFPESYMYRIAKGKWVWAPHYTIHKLLMGLYDMYELLGNQQALDMMSNIASWFYKWTGQFSQEEMDDLLDLETGGMLEVWSQLYGVTGHEQHRELIYRYDRRRFFDALLRGEDVLTNKHANTQIPEILGAARAWEVTGDRRWRDVVEAFWKCAVTDRGYGATGAADDGELWIPPGKLSDRLGVGQEHCCNYNMMRLANVLLRWTGDAEYADYWERRFINGVLAHQNGEDGMVSYFLGIGAGSQKKWGTPTKDFWCCHGTLMQANSAYQEEIFMRYEEGIAVCQWIPSILEFEHDKQKVKIQLSQDAQFGLYPLNEWSVSGMEAITRVDIPPIPTSRPNRFVYRLTISCDNKLEFGLKLRLPWWLHGTPTMKINGVPIEGKFTPSSFIEIKRTWKENTVIDVEFPKTLTTETLPGQPGTVAFLDGPIVLAGLVAEERQLSGNLDEPESILLPDHERQHSWWNPGYYRTKNQPEGIRFIPLYEVMDQRYSVYFPIVDKKLFI
ncbi:beta-L-arabinofuranosidase domain-containing protein [Paenibacillus fonticola]|uniref:beta-L-arabinofuranosidase domain-containing protein n=1 Tax=Paenibacillus fonticola TaxID=379896 RepID=UPI00037936FD|nr:beta-L-arabinofuranosidase domain-containing protein [Paenibacillus fonticola]